LTCGDASQLRLVRYRAVSWGVGWQYCRPKESEKSSGCPLHGGGAAAQSLVGRLLAEGIGSRHVYGGDSPAGPLDMWLIDNLGATVHVTTGSDGCLIVEESEPHADYDMGD
jgi:hypothetical protein